jgi:hypothetical protein
MSSVGVGNCRQTRIDTCNSNSNSSSGTSTITSTINSTSNGRVLEGPQARKMADAEARAVEVKGPLHP